MKSYGYSLGYIQLLFSALFCNTLYNPCKYR
jgi:hypothetical protein